MDIFRAIQSRRTTGSSIFSETTLAARVWWRIRAGTWCPSSAIAKHPGAKRRDKAWGETRYSSGTTPTDYRYTGQREEAGIGLYYYRARWYDAELGRFTSPDSILRNLGNVKELDRYAYAQNNPLLYLDPSGHVVVCAEACDEAKWGQGRIDWDAYLATYGVSLFGKWTLRNKLIVVTAVGAVGQKYSSIIGGSAADAFREVHGTSQDNPIWMIWGTNAPPGASLTSTCAGIVGGGCTSSSRVVNFAYLSMPGGNRSPGTAATSARNNVVHELGHAFAARWRSGAESGPYNTIGSFENRRLRLTAQGFHPSPESASLTWRQHPSPQGNEVFADMFLGWTFDMWDSGAMGVRRERFMATNMAEWVTQAAGG